MSYILNTTADQQAMLQAIGAGSIDELFQSIPEGVRLKRSLEMPPALSEMELTSHLAELAHKSKSPADKVCFLGGGAYDHFVPAVVDTIAGRSEYYTAYTPYQAEASQGSLQAFFEYQTLICQLTGMDVSNASLYEGGSAVAEAAIMAMGATNRHGRIIVPESLHPQYRQTLLTYLANLDTEVVTIPTHGGTVDPDALRQVLTDDTACVVIQHPNFFGCLEDVAKLAEITHERKALFVVSVDPISLGVLKQPGDYGADIVIAEGQALGTPLQFGGPYLGVLACKESFVRKMPGRLVGQTVDRQGKRCWVLTMQTREQHIRREKATSNICTNQGLLALRATVYLSALGPIGLRETAELCIRKAHYAADQLTKIPGIKLRFDRPFFKEFTIQITGEAKSVLHRLLDHGYHGGIAMGSFYPWLGEGIGIAVTERRTRTEIDGLADAYRNTLKG